MSGLPEGWVETTLGEVAKIVDGDRGKNYPNGGDFSSIGYCLFLNTKNIPDRNFVFTETSFITFEKDEQLGKGKLNRYDFVLTTRGTVGNYAFYSEDIPYKNIRINSGMVILRFNQEKRFFYHWLGSPQFKRQIISLQSGSAQPQLPIKDLKLFLLNLPPLPEQKAIAAVLSAFDDKIELLREQNQTLETLAQTIFKEWFVHFNFPDKNGKPYRDHGGEMVDSELGKIPKGWEYKAIETVADRIAMGPFGSNIKVSTFVKEGIPIISGQHLHGTMLSDGGNNFITSEHAEKLKNSKVVSGDIIFTHAGNIGQVSIIPEDANYSEYIVSERKPPAFTATRDPMNYHHKIILA